jgi:nucleotide-binding universal stress UspA family protein
MKTIVLATDFSHNANQAARFAVQLARDWKAELILLNAYHFWPDNPAKTGDFPLSEDAIRETSEKKLKHLADELSEVAVVPIHCLVQEGHTMNAIRAVTKAKNADLLIMSTVGTAPKSTQLLGSIATGMVEETEVPLLLIPPGIGYAGIKNIVLGVDLAIPPNAIALETALEFARASNSLINVLCITEKPNNPELRDRAEHIRRLLLQVPHTMSLVKGSEVYDTLLQFSHDNKADLIMMLPQTRSWLWKLFSEGETQRMARLTDIPLLAVV